MVEQQHIQQNPNYVHPSQIQEANQALASLTKLLTDAGNVLVALRKEFRGEALYQSDDGSSTWVQVSKPVFIKIDSLTRKPIMQVTEMPWAIGTKVNIFTPNDEAIDEILSMLKFAGINQITALAGIDNNNYLDDLKEFECKLASTLMLKQVEWGIDKETLPMMQFKIKTIVQDARSLALEGRTLKALQTTVQRVEQLIEGDKKTKLNIGSTPY